MGEAAWDPLRRELETERRLGCPPRLWLRDDDAVADTPALRRLLGICRAGGLAPLIAVIPARAEASLFAALAGSGARVAVHGIAHANHAPPGEKKQELGVHRPVATTLAELAAARERLQWLGGELVLPVLVPPWNRIAPQLLRRLPEAGFVGISGRVSKSAPPPPAVPGLARADIRVDLLDWEQGPRAKPAGAVAAELAAALRDTRAEKGAVGLLTHHLVFDANAWQAFEELVTCITNGAATDWYDWVSLFTRQAPTNGGVVPCTSQGHEPS